MTAREEIQVVSKPSGVDFAELLAKGDWRSILESDRIEEATLEEIMEAKHMKAVYELRLQHQTIMASIKLEGETANPSVVAKEITGAGGSNTIDGKAIPVVEVVEELPGDRRITEEEISAVNRRLIEGESGAITADGALNGGGKEPQGAAIEVQNLAKGEGNPSSFKAQNSGDLVGPSAKQRPGTAVNFYAGKDNDLMNKNVARNDGRLNNLGRTNTGRATNAMNMGNLGTGGKGLGKVGVGAMNYASAVAGEKGKQSANALGSVPRASISEKIMGVHRGAPAVRFGKLEVKQLNFIEKYLLIGKFSWGKPSMEGLRRFLAAKYVLKGTLNVGWLDPRHVTLSFSNEEDCLMILLKEQIAVEGGFPMRLFRWTLGFCTDRETSLAPVWIRFPMLSANLFNTEALRQICKPMGTFLTADYGTLNFTRPSYARVKVEIDVLKPLVNVEGLMFMVEAEWPVDFEAEWP